MNPFSSRYYLMQNKARVSKITFIISMLALIYVGGLYLTNISEEAKAILRERRDFVEVMGTFDDTEGEQIRDLAQQVKSYDNVEVLGVRSNFYRYKTMLGFKNGGRAYVINRSDFKQLNDKLHLISPEVEIIEDTVFLSNKLARYLNVKDQELITFDTEDVIMYQGDKPYKVITFPSKAFTAYFVTEDTDDAEFYLVTRSEGSSESEFLEQINALKGKYDKVKINTYNDAIEELFRNFQINNVIYYSIIAILAIVFAITTNAVFVGLYDKRKQEFALYRGIGIQKKLIYKKVAVEILYMNGIGIIMGAGIIFLTVSLLNKFIYYKDGISMWYYHPMAFLAIFLCDLAILIPGIGLRIRSISKETKDLYFL